MVNGQHFDLPCISQHLTPKREAFAQAYVETGNASEAYRRAYNVGEMTKPESVWQSASKLLADPKVASRVAELQNHHQQRHHDVTVDTLTSEYDEARELALGIEQPSAAISATSGKAKLHGYDKGEGSVEINIQQNTVQLTDLELARRLAHVIEAGALMKTPG